MFNNTSVQFAKRKDVKYPKASIIIPSYNHLEDALKPCIESIIKYTNLENKEVIIIFDGDDNTSEYVLGLGKPFKLIQCNWQTGITKAVNLGLTASNGDYIIIINNDIILLEQPKDGWIDLLIEPFLDNDKVAATGPVSFKGDFLGFDIEFIDGFCWAISRKALIELGGLDESFLNYADILDYCLRAESRGYKTVRLNSGKQYSDDGITMGNFPIYHISEARTTLNFSDYNNTNRDITYSELIEKYKDKIKNI